MNLVKAPLEASRDFVGRMFRIAANAERERVKVEIARKIRPAAAFGVAEGVLGVATLCSAISRKSWLSYAMGATLFAVACGHAYLDIREQKILDLLSEKLS